MFSLAKYKPAKNVLDEFPDIRQSPALKDKLNDSQFAAVDMLLRHSVSLIWGPPGTGKSRVFAETLLFIMEHTDEKAVVCAVTNVAVD